MTREDAFKDAQAMADDLGETVYVCIDRDGFFVSTGPRYVLIEDESVRSIVGEVVPSYRVPQPQLASEPKTQVKPVAVGAL